MGNSENITRRPLKSRDTKWAKAIAGSLAHAGIRPNVISVTETMFAAPVFFHLTRYFFT